MDTGLSGSVGAEGVEGAGEAGGASGNDVAMLTAPPTDSGNHSSEEELEEIITNKRPYVMERDCKRKWTDLSPSDEASCESDAEFEEPELRPATTASASTGSSASSDTASGDEEGGVAVVGAPLQFSTSPPVDAHRPRRSLSPPPKLFTFSGPLGGTVRGTEQSTSDTSRLHCSTAAEHTDKKLISPRKRSRTSRVHHIQRPCLDFEKMQQVGINKIIV